MKPSERFKKRYVSFVLSSEGAPLPFGVAKECIHQFFISFFGELGIATLAFKLIKYDDKTGRGIVRCERNRVDEAIFCMACLAGWKGKAARMEPLSTSGTIRRL